MFDSLQSRLGDVFDRLRGRGALSEGDGQVALEWSRAADRLLTLRWTEDGGPPVTVPTREGFGSRVIARMIGDLKGTTHFEWHPMGLVCEITFQS